MVSDNIFISGLYSVMTGYTHYVMPDWFNARLREVGGPGRHGDR